MRPVKFGERDRQTLRHSPARWGEEARPGYDHGFRRMWNMYLIPCAARFQSGAPDAPRLAVARLA